MGSFPETQIDQTRQPNSFSKFIFVGRNVFYNSWKTCLFDMKLPFCNSQVQWNPVNTVTDGSKKFGRINGVAVLSGQSAILIYTTHRIHTSWTTVFSLINNRKVDIAYRNCTNYLKLSFST